MYQIIIGSFVNYRNVTDNIKLTTAVSPDEDDYENAEFLDKVLEEQEESERH